MTLLSFFFPGHFFEILYRHPPVAIFLRPCQPFNHMQAVPLLENAFRKRQTVDFQNKMVKTLVYTGVLLCYCFLDVSPLIRIFTTLFLLTSLTILLLRLSSAKQQSISSLHLLVTLRYGTPSCRPKSGNGHEKCWCVSLPASGTAH